MSHDPSRKTFLAKLIGIAAVAGFAPRLLAKRTIETAVSKAPVTDPNFALRPDARAVARRADTV